MRELTICLIFTCGDRHLWLLFRPVQISCKRVDRKFEFPIPLNFQVTSSAITYLIVLCRWDTSVGGFAFANQFLQISTRLPSENLYGMGENLHFSFRHNLDYQTWPLWSRDQPPHSGDETMVIFSLYCTV